MVTNTIVINLGTRRAPMVNKDMGSMVRGAMDKDITSWAGTYVLLRWSAGWREVRHLAWMMPEPRLVDDVACQMVVEWTIHFLRGWCKISSANLVLLLVFFFSLSVASLYSSASWLRFFRITSLGVSDALFH